MQDLINWIKTTGMEKIIWATDLDLTVLDSHKDPTAVSAPDGVEEHFKRLNELTNNRFFIITGRDMAYVDKLFPNTSFRSSCEYHNMVRFDTTGVVHEPNPRPKWSLIDKELEHLTKQHPGLTFRSKPFMRSMHYTHAASLANDPSAKDAVVQKIQTLLDFHEASTGQKLENIDGGSVFDLAPFGSTKKTAYEAILKLTKAKENDLIPIYFGDSPGDIPAAKVVRDNGGIFISVGSDERLQPYADFELKNPAECRDLIKEVASWSKKDPKPSKEPKAP